MEFLKTRQDKTVTVRDIAEHMRSINCPVNVTTIYRYLDKLEKDGNLMKYTGEKGDKAAYQYVERGHRCDEHLHLKCTECGSVIHLDCRFMNQIAEHIEKDHSFHLQCRNSVLYGLCGKCREKEQK